MTTPSIGPGWEGARNLADLGGLPLEHGGHTAYGVVWASAASPEGVDVVHAPTEDPDDEAFLAECGPWLDHPRSWEPNLRRYPDKIARAVSAVAGADGGVLVHCAGGRDRTGMVGSLLLAVAGVTVEGLVENYARGFRGAAEHRGHGMAYDVTTGGWLQDHPDQAWEEDELEQAIEERRPALRAWHASFDVTGYLEAAGIDRATQRALGQRLRGSVW